ncbi:MAG: hypothetical protein R2715_19470 [Ilumatobacteraceae bacterium]
MTVDPSVVRYAVDLVHATRNPGAHQLADLEPYLAVGVSPRASIGLVRAAKALAIVRGRTYATPQDVYEIAPEVFATASAWSYEALARDIGVEVVQRILTTVPAAYVTPPSQTSSTSQQASAPQPQTWHAPSGNGSSA